MKKSLVVLLGILVIFTQASASTVSCKGPGSVVLKKRFAKMSPRELQTESVEIFEALKLLMFTKISTIGCSSGIQERDEFALQSAACLEFISVTRKLTTVSKIKAHPDYSKVMSAGSNLMNNLNQDLGFEGPMAASCYDQPRKDHVTLLTDNVDLSAAMYVISEL